MISLVLATLIILIGSFVQSSIGFGLAIVSSPLLYLIDPAFVPAPITIVALALSLANTWRFRQSISMDGLWAAIIGRVPGTAAGGVLLTLVDARTLSLWIGLFVLIAVVVSLSSTRFAVTPGRMAVAGFFSGFMGTSSGIGGPPMALLLQHQSADLIRANLSAFFIVSCVLSITAQIPAGYLTVEHVKLSLPLIPAALVGFWLAIKVGANLDKQQIRRGSLVLCSVSATGAVLSYFLQ